MADDIRSDDAEALITALKMLKGVIDVTPQESTSSDHIEQSRVKVQIRKELYAFIEEKLQ
ncbi:hypothetical protein ACX27_04180 [Nostoc piscinale CENA21]|uniref:Uncharacterized protein n=1 Tax=Nostoc piscinale CENA21 TaxID=224013 RepID=A0A0M5MG26_9NOSO|nr:hypothetical protein [Nostoc piscinale]ALF52230.1 hypothetical protein ACX27_04180 [Nostoc piscinale CENA21]